MVYVWKTLSATVDGQPTNLTASGEITLTDAGFSQGFGQVTTTSIGGTMVNQILDGVASASFQMFDGPDLITGNTNVLVNLIATVHGQYLDVTAEGGPFFVNALDTDAYFTMWIWHNILRDGQPKFPVFTGQRCREGLIVW